jgi:hypothetical protein
MTTNICESERNLSCNTYFIETYGFVLSILAFIRNRTWSCGICGKTKWRWGRFSPSSSVSPAVVVRSTIYSTITLMYHLGKMYNRPICGRNAGAYMNLGDLQRDLMGVMSHPTKKKKKGKV